MSALGHSQPSHSALVPANVRYAPERGNKISVLVSAAMSERRLPVTGQVSERLTRELSAMKGGPL
jgi:hypothetical protein